MKLYDFNRAPNARRVRIFLAEKSIDIERISVDLNSREQMGEEFKAINPRLQVPALLLDNGALLTESVAICRYLDELHPEPPLFGANAFEKAEIEMWHRRMELEGLQPTADAVRNAGGGDIDAGAEVMHNMMKNLEAGGQISEESQGIGAQGMYDNMKQLEKRIA